MIAPAKAGQTGGEPDWGVATPAIARLLMVAATAIVGSVCAAAGVLGWIVGGPGFGAGAAGATIGAVAGALALQRSRLLAATGARAVAEGNAPRLLNLVEGLAATHGMARPRVFIFDRPDPNAFVWGGRRPVVALSHGAVSDFTRTEIEAVVAHCLTRLRFATVRGLPVAILLGRLAAPAGPLVGLADDVAAAAVTRYPPALRSALAKCSPAQGPHAPAFFAADSWSHRPTPERIRALDDL
ncbi:MAG: M48 family metalloprotease [Actinomycetota bacterium]